MALITGALAISVGNWFVGKLADKGFDSTVDKLTNVSLIDRKFKTAINKVSKDLQKKYPNILGGSIEHFFTNEEVFEELMKLLFRGSKINEHKILEKFDTSTLPPSFIITFISDLRIELSKDKLFDEIFSNNEIFISITGIGIDVKEIAEITGKTLNEIREINQKLSEKIEEKFDIEQFIQIYSANAVNNLSQVNFIGLGIDINVRKKWKYLQDIFVKPSLRIYQARDAKKLLTLQKSKRTPITYDNILDFNKQIVLLGNPGSGKSIMLKSLLCDILSKKKSYSKKYEKLIPFRIELRKYLSFKNENGGNLLKYFTAVLINDYQLNNITEQILVNIISEKNCLMLFDGLDEIFDIKDKISTKNDIENFHNTYPKAHSITTSRIIGYDEASLNENFQTIYIENFNNDQIKEYVSKWYIKEEEVVEVRDIQVNEFFSKMHEIDNELISNPLLLSLIVILFRNILKIPESKLEIYQSCTKTLVDKWDAEKELKMSLPQILLKEKDKLFADLAYWQYHQLSSDKANISYEKAKQKVSESIIRLKLADEFSCENSAEGFMEYALKRSIYFDNNFTHKTFLEYYTAYWIYSNIEKKHRVNERNEIIKKYDTNPFWYIVLELLLNLIDKDQGDTDIVDEIVNEQIKRQPDTLPFVLSVAFKLKNISQSIPLVALETAIDHLVHLNHNASSTDKNIAIFKSLETLYHQTKSGREVLLAKLVELENKNLDNDNYLLGLYQLYIDIQNPLKSNSITFKLSRKRLDELMPRDKYLFLVDNYFIRPSIPFMDSIAYFIKSYGKGKLYSDLMSKHAKVNFGQYINLIISQISNESSINDISKNLKQLNNLGISNREIIEQIIRRKNYYYTKDLSDKILKLLSTVDDKEVRLILLLFLGYNHDSKIQNYKIPHLSSASKNLFIKALHSENPNEINSFISKYLSE